MPVVQAWRCSSRRSTSSLNLLADVGDHPRHPAPADAALDDRPSRRTPPEPPRSPPPAAAPPRRAASASALRLWRTRIGLVLVRAARGHRRVRAATSPRTARPSSSARRTSRRGGDRALRHRPARPGRVVALPLRRPHDPRPGGAGDAARRWCSGTPSGSSRPTSRGKLDDVLMRVDGRDAGLPADHAGAGRRSPRSGPKEWLIVLAVGLTTHAARRARDPRRGAGDRRARLRRRRRGARRVALAHPASRGPAQRHRARWWSRPACG